MSPSPTPTRSDDGRARVAAGGRPRRPALLATVVLVLAVLTSGLLLVLGPSGAQTSESTGTS